MLHLIPYFGSKNIGEITRKDIKEYYFSCRDRIKQSIGKHRTIVNQIWDFAEDCGYISEEQNTVRTVKAYAAKSPRKNDEIIDNEEDMVGFISSFLGTCLFLPVLLAGGEGMRMSEAIGLKWSSLNLETGYAHIKCSLHHDKENGGYYEELPKTVTSARKIKLSQFVIDFLKKIKEERKPKEDDYICLNSKGMPFNTKTLSLNFRRAARTKKRDYRNIEFKSLRTSFINIMRDKGVEDVVIQEHVGHGNINTTRQHYFQGTRKQRKQLEAAKEDIFKKVLAMTRSDMQNGGQSDGIDEKI